MADKNGDPILDGPFGHQLVHGDAEIDAFWRSELARSDPTTHGHPDHAITPSPGLSFLPSASSSGWLVSGLPIETTAANKKFVRYGGYGFVELSARLLEAICPSDLSGEPCAWDETWVWDPKARKWLGGCQMIRLCSRRQHDPQPAPPAFSPYHYALHVGREAHDPLLALRNTPADVLALFKYPAAGNRPAMLTNLRDPHGVRGSSGDRSDWPSIVPSPLPPVDPEHTDSCTAIHGIERSCFTLRDQPNASQEALLTSKASSTASGSTSSYHTARATSPSVASVASYYTATADQESNEEEAASTTKYHSPSPTIRIQPCAYHADSATCPFGHDFPAMRTAAFQSHRQHALDAERLVRAGRAMRTQRRGDGVVDVLVYVEGYQDQYQGGDEDEDENEGESVAHGDGNRDVGEGQEGKFIVDGRAEVRARWAREHVDGPRGACRVCEPAPPLEMGSVGIDARAEREEGWQGARMIMELSRARWLEGRREMREMQRRQQQQRQGQGSNAWEGDDMEEGLLSRWRERMGR